MRSSTGQVAAIKSLPYAATYLSISTTHRSHGGQQRHRDIPETHTLTTCDSLCSREIPWNKRTELNMRGMDPPRSYSSQGLITQKTLKKQKNKTKKQKTKNA
jgi:hypothetical protein